MSVPLYTPIKMIRTYLNSQTSVVFLLLSAQNLKSLFDAVSADLHVCTWIFIVAGALLGPCWLGTPKDSWPIAVGAMICTAIACLFIIIGMIIDSKKEHHESEPDAITFNSFSTSLGTIFFAWGGSAMFPTIQVDMHHKDRFHLAVIAAYIFLLIFYLPVSIVGYVIYGSDVQDNVLKNLPQNFFRYAVEILITGHLAMAFTIVLNPIFQGFEEVTHVPKRFCWQRALLRSAVVILIALMAETVPNFGPILSFIGGSTVSILGFILPVICYVTIKLQATRLSGERLVNNIFRVIPKLDIILLILSLIVGLYGAIASSYSSFADLVNPKSYGKPCWIDWSAADPSNKTGNKTLF